MRSILALLLSRFASLPIFGSAGTAVTPVAEDGADGRQKLCWPLSYHLIALTLAIMLPLLILAGISLKNSFEAERETATQHAQRIVDGIMAGVDREILSAITLLNVLANDKSFDRGEFQLLHQRAREALYERMGHMLLILPSNKVVFSTNAEFGAQTPPIDPAMRVQAPTPSNLNPEITDLYVGANSARFAVIVPVIRRGKAVAKFHLTFQPGELAAAFADPALPANWNFALGDRKGLTVLSSGSLARIGEPLPAPLGAGLAGNSGFMEITHEGAPILAGYRRSRTTAWLGIALIPLSAIEAPLAKVWNEFFLTGFTLLAISLVGAYLLSQTMTRPIQDLTRAALAFGRGDAAPIPRSRLVEANVLAAAMSQASTDLRQRTDALSESERRFRLFAEQTPDVIWFLDVEKDRIAYISPAFEQIWGRGKDELGSISDWRKAIHPDDLSSLTGEIEAAGPHSFQAEYRVVRPDGGIRWVRDTRFLLEQAEDQPRLIAGIMRDFTARKEALDALQSARSEAENRLVELEHLYECSPVGLAVIEHGYRLQRINAFMARARGNKREDVIGKPIFDVLPELADVAPPLFEEILAGGDVVKNVEFRTGGTRDETVKYWAAHFYPIMGENREVAAIGIVLEDNTIDKLHQRALARLASIVYAANDAMFSTSPSGLILNWNPAAEVLFQYTPEEAIGRPFSGLFPNGHNRDYDLLFAEVKNGESVRLDTELCRKDKSTVPVSVSIAPIKDGGEMAAVSVSIEDITERKRFEERQLLMNRELSHRVKNSLAVIQAMARHTLRSSPTPQAFTAAFEGRLQALAAAHNLLTESHWEGAELTQLIRDQLAPTMVGLERLTLQGKRVKLPPGVATSLGLVLHELATNAVKYGSLSVPKGKVDISWDVTQSGKARTLRLDWRESGGPAVEAPGTKGFGSTLIEYSGKVTQHFHPDGLHCSMEMTINEDAQRAY